MLRRTIARALEDGRPRGPLTALAARLTATVAARALVRPLAIPPGPRVVCVGGATLGGSGKTRVAVAIAELAASTGRRVVLIGHAYRARPGRARVVAPSDAVADVGDEALVCARALHGIAEVVVGRSRAEATALAAALEPDVLVLDGPLQLAPVRATLAVLAVDARQPWGSGAVVPAGDLRARPADLLAAADLVVPVDALASGARAGAFALEDLASLRIGLFTALARPRRLVEALARGGIVPSVHVEAPDHGPVPPSARSILAGAPVDAWVATSKCAVHLRCGGGPNALSAPIAELEPSFRLPPPLADAVLRALPGPGPGPGRLTSSRAPSALHRLP